METLPSPASRHAYLVGSGIASLAAAVFLIRDGKLPGAHIHLLEEASLLGGSLDGAGQADAGYVLRGGRMLNFTCPAPTICRPPFRHWSTQAGPSTTIYRLQRADARARKS